MEINKVTSGEKSLLRSPQATKLLYNIESLQRRKFKCSRNGGNDLSFVVKNVFRDTLEKRKLSDLIHVDYTHLN